MTFLLGTTLKVSLVVFVGLAAAAMLRNRSAAARHWVLAAAMLCAIAMPALELVVPAWGIHTLGSSAGAGETPLAAPPTTTEEVSNVESLEVTGIAAAATAAAPQPAITRFVVPAWMLGSGLSLAILAVGLSRLMWLASHARPVEPGTWTRLAAEIGRDFSIGRPVQLLQSDHPSLLVTWGLLRPKVILPRAAQSWTEERAAIVLRHELAHIRRGDWILQIAGELLRTAYWFNPLLWIACTRLRQESEQACDDEVLTAGVQGPDYATHLLELARVLKVDSAPHLPAPAIARSSSLERRFRAMLDARLTRKPTTRSFRFMTAGGLLAATVAIAATQTGPVKLSGSVFDGTGAPVPGVTVVLTNAQSQAKHEVKTDAAGYYEFVPLPADSYVLDTKFPGFGPLDEPIRLAGTIVRRDLTMPLGSLQETISVRGGAELEYTVKLTADKTVLEKAAVAAVGEKIVAQKAAGAAPYSRDAFQRALDTCKPSPTGGRVRPPRKIKDVRPIYPAHLQEASVTGTVVLKAVIATDGTVREALVEKSAHPDLDNAAIEAVRQWLFDGTLLNCAPVEVSMRVSLNFGM